MRRNIPIFLLLFFVFSFLYKTDFSFDQDLGRHLKLGEIIWQTKSVPKTNLFSYTNPDFPFINSHWLFEVFVYLFNQSFGIQPLIVVKMLIILLTCFLVFRTIGKKNYVLLLPIGFIFAHVLRERTEFRPEVFSFLFTALTVFILTKYLQQKTKLIYLLPLIQLIWINTHIYFFVGLVIQSIFLLQVIYQYLRSHTSSGKQYTGATPLKSLGIIFMLSILISLINPNGITGFLYPLNVTKNYGYTIVENQTLFLLENIGFTNPNFLFVKLCWGIAVLSIVFAIVKKRLQLVPLLLIIFGVILALLNVRSFPYLFLLSLPATLDLLRPVRNRNWTKVLGGFVAVLLLLESLSYLSGNYYLQRDDQYQPGLSFVESGKSALDFVLKNDLPGPVFNNFDIGSYIIYRAYPKYRVFIDGRPEAYPATFFNQTYIPVQSDYAKFKLLDSQINFQTIVFSVSDQTPWGKSFLTAVVKDQDYNIVYIDDFIVVLVKNKVVKEKGLKIIDLSKLNPQDYDYTNHRSYLNLALFLITNGYTNSALNFTKKALQIFPKSPTANALFINLGYTF